MKTLSVSDLPAFFSTIKGATFATIVTNTDARVKAACPFGRNVRKVSRVNVCLGFQYEAAVNRQRTREDSEPDFKADARKWGERVPGTFLVTHKGKTYLETKVEKSLGHEYRDAAGNLIPDADLAPYLPSRSGSGRQDVEKAILVRDYAFDSIRAISCKGEDYVVA